MATEPWEDSFTQQLSSHFPISQFARFHGQDFLVTAADTVFPLTSYLKSTCGYTYLVDLTAVDRLQQLGQFEIFLILYNYASRHRLRIKTHISAEQALPSLTPLFDAANWLEREIFDLFGISFTGHPNLKRILMPDDWQGHPLRKDYSILNMDQAWVRKHLGIESGQ